MAWFNRTRIPSPVCLRTLWLHHHRSVSPVTCLYNCLYSCLYSCSLALGPYLAMRIFPFNRLDSLPGKKKVQYVALKSFGVVFRIALNTVCVLNKCGCDGMINSVLRNPLPQTRFCIISQEPRVRSPAQGLSVRSYAGQPHTPTKPLHLSEFQKLLPGVQAYLGA